MNLESVNYSYEDPQANRELFAKSDPPLNAGEGGNPVPNGKPEPPPPPPPEKPGNPVPNGG